MVTEEFKTQKLVYTRLTNVKTSFFKNYSWLIITSKAIKMLTNCDVFALDCSLHGVLFSIHVAFIHSNCSVMQVGKLAINFEFLDAWQVGVFTLFQYAKTEKTVDSTFDL